MNFGRILKGSVRPLRRSWWTVVAALTLGLTLGVVLIEQFPARYRAELSLPPNSEQSAQSALELATVERLAQRAGVEDHAAFRASLDYSVDEQSGRRLLSVVAVDAPKARSIVGHWAHILDGSPVEDAVVIAVASVEPPPASRFYALGLAIGLMLFVGPLSIRGAIDPLIWTVRPMRELQVPLIDVIPRISTPDMRAERRKRILVNFGLSGICLAIVTLAMLTHVS
jgi:hypothetical protein